MSRPPRQLDVIQRWMQAVISHPLGPACGADSDDAMREIDTGSARLDAVINPSSKLDALRRIEVYAHAYYGRLIECMAKEFPVLARTVGQDTFNEFTFGYLQDYPSRSYTLDRLSSHFAQYLSETRPDREGLPEGVDPPVGWPDFLIDLCRLEWTINEVFDADGVEGLPIISPSDLAGIRADHWPQVRLQPVVCLRLLVFKFPVNDYFTAVRRSGEGEPLPEMPATGDQYVAVFRREYVVRRQVLSRVQFELLSALKDDATLSVAIERAAAWTDLSDADLAVNLRNWFERWTAAGMFFRVEGLG
jgi:hypothetical protein